jgi:hypothetical protein
MSPVLIVDPVPLLVARGALVLLFASAALHKLRDRAGFVGVLAAYRLLPADVVPAAAATVAAGELAVAGALLWPGGSVVGALGGVALLALYSLAIAINLARGRRTVDCGCGARGARQPISEWLLVRNAGVALAALALVRPLAPRPLLWIDWLTVVGGTAVVACAWMAAHGLAAAAARVRAGGAPS